MRLVKLKISWHEFFLEMKKSLENPEFIDFIPHKKKYLKTEI